MKKIFKVSIISVLLLFACASVGKNAEYNYYDQSYWQAAVVGEWTGSAWGSQWYNPLGGYVLNIEAINTWWQDFRPDAVVIEYTGTASIQVIVYDRTNDGIGNDNTYTGGQITLTFESAEDTDDLYNILIAAVDDFEITDITFYKSGGAYAGKLVDLPLRANLNDRKGGLTGGAVSRISAATYVDSTGVLRTAWGNRDQLIDTSAQNDFATWWTLSAAGNSTGNSLIGSIADTNHYAVRTSLLTSGKTYIFSAEMKPGLESWGALQWYDGTFNRTFFGLSDGEVGSSSYTAPLIKDAVATSDGYYRCWIVFSPIATSNVYIYAAQNDGDTTFSGDNTNASIYVRNIMLEELPGNNTIGSDLFDQESLGNELVTNGGFSTDTDWIKGTGWSISGGVASSDGSQASNSWLYQNSIGMTANKIYRVEFTVSNYSAGSVLAYIGNASIPGSWKTASGTYVFYQIAIFTGANQVAIQANSDFVGSIDNVSVKELTSPHKGTYGWPYSAGPEHSVSDPMSSNNTSNWDTIDCTLAFDTDHYEVNYTNATQWIARQNQTFSVQLYHVSVDIKDGTTSGVNVELKIGTVMGAGTTFASGTTTASWATLGGYFFAAAGQDTINILTYLLSGNIELKNFNVRPVQTSWVPYGSNKIEIDSAENALKITGDGSSLAGAYLSFRDSSDFSKDPTLNRLYQIKFKAKVASGDFIQLRVRGTVEDVYSPPIAETFTEYTVYFKQTDLSDWIQFSSLDLGDVIWIKDITYRQVPELSLLEPSDFVNSTTIPAKPRFETNGLLVEPQATNLMLYSEDFSQWGKDGAEAEAFNQVGPDGVSNSAATFTDPGSSSVAAHKHLITSVINASTYYAVSVFVKKGTSEDFTVGFRDNSNNTWLSQIDFGWSSGVPTILAADNGSGVIEAVGNGWFRVRVVGQSLASPGAQHYVYISATRRNETPSTSKTTIFFGAQLEQGAFVTSYIPANGAVTTRTSEAADGTYGYSWTMSQGLKNVLGAASPSVGTMIVELNPLFNAGAGSAERGIIACRNYAPSILYMGTSAGSLTATDASSWPGRVVSWVYNDTIIVAVRWSSTTTDFKLSRKYSGSWSHSSGHTYDGAFTIENELRLFIDNDRPFHIKNIVFYDQYLTDAELQREIWNAGTRGIFKMGMGVK